MLSASVYGQETVAENVDVKTFKSKMESSTDAQIVDVRTEAEWAGGIIPGAVKMNYYDTDFVEKVKTLDKTKPVFVYCKAGGRSAGAMGKMKKLGFVEIYNLNGGITAWKNAGYEISQ